MAHRARALVTGAGRRVGAAIARRLGQAGMQVAVHYHEAWEGAEATCRAIRQVGGEALALRADLRDREQVRRLVGEAGERMGGLDLLVASAAGYDSTAFDAIDDARWDATFALNLDAQFVLAHAARDLLRASRGSIVFITCTSPMQPYRNYLPYIVAKAGLSQLVKTMALELAPDVRVNAVAPGVVLPPPDMPVDRLAAVVQQVPLGRAGSAEDVAEAVLYLTNATYVTGHELVVDGGRSVGRLGEPEGSALP